jgi:hypothetical protein
MTRVWILFYGSCMCAESRSRTLKADNLEEKMAAVPVTVMGFQRTWGATYSRNAGAPKGRQMSAVTAVVKSESTCSAVCVPFDKASGDAAAALAAFDVREKGYDRVTVAFTDVTCIISSSTYADGGDNDGGDNDGGEKPAADDEFYIYVHPAGVSHTPTSELPIAQSYLDVILHGAGNINESFARTFLATTHEWGDGVVDDRHAPMYARPLATDVIAKLAAVHDAWLQEARPKQLTGRRLHSDDV